jgi:hypothetical protein
MHVEEQETFCKHGLLSFHMKGVGALVISQSDEQEIRLTYLGDSIIIKDGDIM